jgi:MerR family transcriptional regulator, thiopeptide resistance regulator
MPTRRTYQVKEVAQLAGLTVRALHHYDSIGLLVPSTRSTAGYRLYDDDDLLRLQQVLIGRELGLSLEAIRRTLDDPGFDRRAALLAQRIELAARAERATDMIRAIDAALTAIEEKDMGKVDFKTIFAGFDPKQYEDEVKQRWGNTDAYKISAQRAKSYTEADWQTIREEQGAIYADAVTARNDGVRPDEPRAMDIAERYRLSFDRWFYPCSPQMHCALADMWEADRRYADNIDKYGGTPGLTAYLAAAVRANAKRSPV